MRSLGDLAARAALGKLHVLTSGHVPSNPSELLSTPAMTTFLAEASEDYDVVLLDAPPVLPVADAAVVAAQADGVLLVYQAGKVGRLHLKRARAHLEGARAKVWGVVLNDVRPEIDPLIYTYDAADADRRRTRGDRARSLIVAGRARPAKTPPGSEALGPTHRRPGRWTPPSRRYGDFWHGVVVLAVSLVVLAGVVGWRLSAFSH